MVEGAVTPAIVCFLEHDSEKWKPLFRKDYAPPMIQSMVATLLKAIML
jgi:hypothetical protein